MSSLAMTSGGESRERIRVVIVAGVRLYREGLVSTLGSYKLLDILGAASSPADATALVLRHGPRVAVLDMAMPGALELIRTLHLQAPNTRILAFALHDDVTIIIDCARAGAAGYVTAEASVGELVDAISRIATGELLCTPRIAAELFRRVGELSERRDSSSVSLSVLTTREREVLGLVRDGLSNKEIAGTLNISEATVKNHVHHLLDKLKVRSRQQAAVRATGSDASRLETRTSAHYAG